jgi:hypothetical protein
MDLTSAHYHQSRQVQLNGHSNNKVVIHYYIVITLQ